MTTDNKDQKQKAVMPRCTLVALIVVALLLLLAFLVMRDNKKTIKGGKWTALGGCACTPPPR